MKKNQTFFLGRAINLKLGILLSVLLWTSNVYCGGDKPIVIQMDANKWDFQQGKVEFMEFKEVKAMKLLPNSGPAMAKDISFKNGTIEFDMQFITPPFIGIFFRKQANNSEYFYLRVGRAGNKYANDAIQYAPYVNGVLLWDLFDHYQAPGNIKANEWNHIKLVVSGYQLRVYVNDMVRPSLEVPRLEGDTKDGAIAFEGQAYIANVVIKPNVTDELAAYEGTDLTNHDANYIRQWMVSQPVLLADGNELTVNNLPKFDSIFQPIGAERRGLVNLTRQFGNSMNNRRYVWLKTTIISDKDQKQQLRLGFSDEVWVFLNKQPIFVDKNLYMSAGIRKTPDGRISLENSSFPISLKSGKNELTIGVANNFYGWGIIARLESMNGIEISKN